jgi:flagellar hook-associated protein 2
MGSPITFSGFNNIDFSVILNAIMTQESQPLTALQTRQKTLQTTDSNYTELASKLGTLQSAASALSNASSVVHYAATSSDSSAISVSGSGSAVPGQYEVIVNELARTQVTASSSTSPDTNTTIVANGGSLTIGGVVVAVTGPVTLAELAAQVNANSAVPASASIVETSPGAYRLVLTSKETGEDGAFLVQNALGSSSVTFTDTDGDGTTGNSIEDHAAQATNASVLINSVAVTSNSNTLDSGIPGVTVQLQEKDPARTLLVTVDRDNDDLAERIGTFITAYNDVVAFANEQAAATGKGTAGALGRDALLRALRSQLRETLSGAHGSGTFTKLAEVGIGFTRTGELSLDRGLLDEALTNSPSNVVSLFADSSTGAFGAVDTIIDEYINSGGFVPDARSRISDELSRLTQRMDDMTARLAVRRQMLQQQFTAADLAMTRLNSQSSALSSFSSNLTL